MRGLWAITRKELYSYLVSPVAYAVAAAFLLINGLVFYFFISGSLAEASLQPVLSSTVFILLLMTPILTMRLIAEERSTGTIELLMTFPVTDLQVVLGKFLATLITYALMLVPTLTYVVVIGLYGAPEVGILISAYLGLLLIGGAYISVGMLASSFANNQVVAGALGFGVLLFLYLLGALGTLAAGPVGQVLQLISALSPAVHFDTFGRGLLDTSDVVYFVTFILGALFLTVRAVESTRWR